LLSYMHVRIHTRITPMRKIKILLSVLDCFLESFSQAVDQSTIHFVRGSCLCSSSSSYRINWQLVSSCILSFALILSFFFCFFFLFFFNDMPNWRQISARVFVGELGKGSAGVGGQKETRDPLALTWTHHNTYETPLYIVVRVYIYITYIYI
jgi:hypothetical protein